MKKLYYYSELTKIYRNVKYQLFSVILRIVLKILLLIIPEGVLYLL